MRKYDFTLLFSIIFVLTGVANSALAVGIDGSFSVSAVIPENQRNTGVTYFDLEMEPGDKQTLEVIIENPTDREIKISQSVNTAVTNSNGVIDYSQSDYERDSTLLHSFDDIASAVNVITLLPKSSQTIPITVDLPDDSFEGVILGGIHYREVEDEETDEAGSVNIKSDFAFVLGLQITVGDVEDIQPELQLNDITPTQRNYRNVVTANLQNTKPVTVSNLSIDAKIYKEGSDDVFREEQKEDMRMAPNSNFDFPISWDNQAFEDGTYVLEMTAVADGETWSWTETFVIGNSEELNEEAVVDESSPNYMRIGILALISSIIIAGILKRRQRKVEPESGE